MTFPLFVLQEKVNIREQLPKYFGSEVSLHTTVCCVLELEHLAGLSPSLGGACHVLKQFPVRRCGHEKAETRVAGAKCLLSMLREGNPEK